MFKKEEKPIKCARCKVGMVALYERSFGVKGEIYQCPKCKGLVQKG